MTDAPKHKAYIVCAAFGLPPSASLHMNACIAASSEAAVAMCVSLFHRLGGVTDEIQGFHCMELTEGFMSDALAAIRGGDKPKIVSLREVEKAEPESPPEPPPPAIGPHAFSSSWGPNGPNGGCGFCGRLPFDPIHLPTIA